MARLLREAPLNSIWEGSGTVTALDALRAVTREPSAADALLAELTTAAGAHPDLDAALGRLDLLLHADSPPDGARGLASLAARCLAAALLVRQAPTAVADLYCATRLGWSGDRTLGELPDGAKTRDVVDAVTPARADFR
jgi:putative acyl-CoA dehydrogenase